MKRDFDECFKHLKDDEESAAECVHCLKKNGEQVIFDDHEKRLKLGREAYDDTYTEQITRVSKILGINSRESYEEADRKFNLTMY